MNRYSILILLIISCTISAQHYINPLSGKLLLTIEGGITSAQTDYRNSVLGTSTRYSLEYFMHSHNHHQFGLKIFLGGQNINGKDDNKQFTTFNTGMYAAGAGFIFSYSLKDFFLPYVAAGISKFWYDIKLENQTKNTTLAYGDKTILSAEGEVGFKFPLSDYFFFNINATFQYLPNDMLDNVKFGKNNDFFVKVLGGFSFSFTGTRDSDDDRIPDSKDACEDLPEDYDGFEDSDGCPDLDNDRDGILDRFDKCPDIAEDNDGFADNDGCPDLDNDVDGIMDALDKCINSPEDYDGFEDNDGCPEIDNDNDGIKDLSDNCANTPEDIDGFQDNDGCPDLDNDADGIPDKDDKCPDVAETVNGYNDYDGCPDVASSQGNKNSKSDAQNKNFNEAAPKTENSKESFVIQGELTFLRDQAEINPDAYKDLDRIIQTMKSFPNAKWRIEGHMDPGNNAGEISKKRAQSIYKYFISKGLPSSRLSTVGLGDKYPVEANDKMFNRMRNRRVVIKRIE